MFFALAFCAASVGQTSAYLQDYARAKNAATLIFQLIWRKSEIDPLSISGSKPVRPYLHYYIKTENITEIRCVIKCKQFRTLKGKYTLRTLDSNIHLVQMFMYCGVLILQLSRAKHWQ